MRECRRVGHRTESGKVALQLRPFGFLVRNFAFSDSITEHYHHSAF